MDPVSWLSASIAGGCGIVTGYLAIWGANRQHKYDNKTKVSEKSLDSEDKARDRTLKGMTDYNDRLRQRIDVYEQKISELEEIARTVRAQEVEIRLLREENEKCKQDAAQLRKEVEELQRTVRLLSHKRV